MRSVCILDYGAGNVRSVGNLFASLLAPDELVLSNDPAAIARATHLVLPGVGAFAAAMEAIRERIPLDALESAVLGEARPFLGICVGMQVLATRGEEFGTHPGLDWIAGTTRQLRSGDLPLPHIGWNDVSPAAGCALLPPEPEDYYFVHSFVFEPQDAGVIQGTATYGETFCAVTQQRNIWGVQFHPEKSQAAGRRLIQTFLDSPHTWR